MGMQTDKVRFNVGGKIFETTATTLASAAEGSSMFGAMFDDEWNFRPREVNEEYFIDRDPEYFSVLLNLLRTGELYVPPHIPDKLFYREALYYGLIDNVRTARFCEFDGNRLKLTSSVKGQEFGNCTAIRASPDGGCAVAHDRIVRLYDWMLEEYPTINLNYEKVNDICWIDLEIVVLSACKRSGREDSGIGLFSSSRGDLKHTFQLNHENQVKSFTAGALCCNSDGKVFAACSGTGVNGIGVWDQVTGKQTGFFDRTVYEPLCDANRIQCLDGNNGTDSSIRWNSESRQPKAVEPSYPKLALHGGQLFSCINDRVSMFCGPDWFLTSSIGRSCNGGAIRDFSIGGDRLFALHSEENVFDVWETPVPPNRAG
ncbi:hypothetical protein C5167_045227 [Papaver somniferum]|uniref:BTB domain-containing protein n=1 Tax=Papaver somniferum TaxID=3469 RepID=A0A4Y7LBQ5_PAPSO|nr:BTB/POZ domain-containing protein At4g30940-like [Papaver somniferum]RZC82447.1 hypothetical protein C5167_045227 [Papaver somniferum]